MPPHPLLPSPPTVQDPPSQLDTLFSRGMDPLVADPSSCHAHPAVPDRWPSRQEVESYVAGVRRRLLAAVGNPPGSQLQLGSADVRAGGAGEGAAAGARGTAGRSLADGGRRVAVVLEHERMHQARMCAWHGAPGVNAVQARCLMPDERCEP